MANKLYRSTDDRYLGGVCGGIAEYTGVDPLLVRLVAIILLLPGGLPGLVPYVLLWLLVPEKPAGGAN